MTHGTIKSASHKLSNKPCEPSSLVYLRLFTGKYPKVGIRVGIAVSWPLCISWFTIRREVDSVELWRCFRMTAVDYKQTRSAGQTFRLYICERLHRLQFNFIRWNEFTVLATQNFRYKFATQPKLVTPALESTIQAYLATLQHQFSANNPTTTLWRNHSWMLPSNIPRRGYRSLLLRYFGSSSCLKSCAVYLLDSVKRHLLGFLQN